MSSRAGGQRCAPLPAHPHPLSHLHEAPIPPRAIWAQGGAGRSGGRTEPPGQCPPRAPHCAGRCSHITPPGQAPRGRSLPPTGAVPGSASLAHWQDFAAVCSEPRFGGAMRAALLLGRVNPGRRDGGDAPHSPPQKKSVMWRGLRALGASRVAMVMLAASSGRASPGPAWVPPPSCRLPSPPGAFGDREGGPPCFWGQRRAGRALSISLLRRGVVWSPQI